MKPVKRRYLTAAERKREILAAALAEFSTSGFVATSLERIAQHAGMSKSGIYAHYSSKDELFEDMLLTSLMPQNSRPQALEVATAESLPDFLDDYLDRRYAALSCGENLAVFRLLIAESGRTPELVRRCAGKLQERMLTGDQEFLQACVARGLARPNIDPDQYLLAGSPAGLWMILMTVHGGEKPPLPLAKVKALHRRLLLDLLQPATVAT